MTAVSEPRQALAGVTVLDLATYLAAPVCATLLGEFGADVIKVEQPRVGDDLRRLGRPVTPSAGGSYWWFVEARNKKSITCNLRDPEGQALIRRLVASASVVTENFRPGTLERWNLGWTSSRGSGRRSSWCASRRSARPARTVSVRASGGSPPPSAASRI
jgi:crotonobetainyl-CoA:carnitine CoA-transferase CaiB-like acyl-CoA transferase